MGIISSNIDITKGLSQVVEMLNVKKNFNKIVDIELYSKSSVVKLECPVKGRKPTVSITGTILPQDNINNFEIRVTNLYLADVQKYHRVKVTAGYEANKSTTIDGSIVNAYIEKPSPDQITVFVCTMASYENWIDKTCDVHYKEGDTLKSIVLDISEKIGFGSPVITSDITESLSSPIDETGLVSNLIQKLQQSFPDVTITIDSNRITVSKGNGTGRVYEIKHISSTPQFTGGGISLTAPWEPQLRCDDFIEINTKFFSKDMSVQTNALKSKYRVVSLEFEFSTTGNENSMTIQGVYV